MRKIHFCSGENLVFVWSLPSCATSPPSGDIEGLQIRNRRRTPGVLDPGAHWDTTIWIYWKLCDFSFRYYVNILWWECHSGGVRVVHQNLEKEKNTSGFFDCERRRAGWLFSCLISDEIRYSQERQSFWMCSTEHIFWKSLEKSLSVYHLIKAVFKKYPMEISSFIVLKKRDTAGDCPGKETWWYHIQRLKKEEKKLFLYIATYGL